MIRALLLAFTLALLGCGDSTPKSATPEQIEEENTKGRELRGNLEGIPPAK